MQLVVELTGKGGNLILVDGAEAFSGKILDRLREDRSRRSPRRIAPGAAYEAPLGVVWDGDVPTLQVWAPTAKSVTFHLFDDADPATSSTTSAMTLDPATGIWSLAGDPAGDGKLQCGAAAHGAPGAGNWRALCAGPPYRPSAG